MDTPWLSERVRVLGQEGRFIVVTVDAEHSTVDLLPAQGTSPCLEAVPFSELVRSTAKRDLKPRGLSN
jgi:hypothetical protein